MSKEERFVEIGKILERFPQEDKDFILCFLVRSKLQKLQDAYDLAEEPETKEDLTELFKKLQHIAILKNFDEYLLGGDKT